MTDPGPPAGLLALLLRFRQSLRDSPLRLQTTEQADATRERDSLLSQLDDYIIPRLVQVDAPLLAVVGGSTGAGKSTLVNSLLGHVVSSTGVLRPTTRSAVLVHNPADAHWFGADRLLPDLERTDRPTGDPSALQLLAADAMPQGLALLDAPDVDSVEKRNRQLAGHLLGAADLWLFVTSAARYADQVPWDYLKAAVSRSTAVAVVLDRTPAGAVSEVRGDLERMLESRGLGHAPLFTVVESELSTDGLLPADVVKPIRHWLVGLAADSAARAAVIRMTLDGAIASLPDRTTRVVNGLRTQEEVAAELLSRVRTSYGDALDAISESTQDGTLLRGEVLARWQEFVGTGEMFKTLESRVSRARDRVTSALKGGPAPAETVSVAVESSLQTLIVEYAEGAAERTTREWRTLPAGAVLLQGADRELGRASAGFSGEVDRMVRAWQGGVLDLVRSEGAGKRTTARYLAYGVNGLGVALMMVIFASTAGVTGAEIGVAGGTALVGQKVLEAVFGDQAVRSLVAQAREDLHRRVSDLWAAEQARYTNLLDAELVVVGAADRLRDLGRELSYVRLTQGRG